MEYLLPYWWCARNVIAIHDSSPPNMNFWAMLTSGATPCMRSLRKSQSSAVTALSGLVVKNSPAGAGDIRDTGLIPVLPRFPPLGGEHGTPLQYSCLENSMDRGVHGLTKSQTRLKRLSTPAPKCDPVSPKGIQVREQYLCKNAGCWPQTAEMHMKEMTLIIPDSCIFPYIEEHWIP